MPDVPVHLVGARAGAREGVVPGGGRRGRFVRVPAEDPGGGGGTLEIAGTGAARGFCWRGRRR